MDVGEGKSGAGACAVSAFVRSGDGGRLRGRGERADCLFCRRGRTDVPRTGERPYSRAKAFDAVSASGAKKKPGAKGLRKGWTMARAVLQSADWELIALHMCAGLEDAGATAMLAGGVRALADGLLAGAGRTSCGDIHIMADFAAQDAAATARCIVSMRVGDIMLAAAKAARKKKRKEGLPWRSIPSKA